MDAEGRNMGWDNRPCRRAKTRLPSKGHAGPLQRTYYKEYDHMSDEPKTNQQTFREFAPKLFELADNVLFGDVWERPELSRRDRSLITVAALVALNRQEQLPFHLKRAQENGLTQDELIEAMTHLAFYAGWPCAVSSLTTAKEVWSQG